MKSRGAMTSMEEDLFIIMFRSDYRLEGGQMAEVVESPTYNC
jgi:hypothetical protein